MTQTTTTLYYSKHVDVDGYRHAMTQQNAEDILLTHQTLDWSADANYGYPATSAFHLYIQPSCRGRVEIPMQRIAFHYRQHCAQRNAPVINSFTGRFWGFSPRRATRCTDGVKFGTEGGSKVPSSVPISPQLCNSKGIGPPKLKFLLKFDQNVEYRRPTGAYSFPDFYKIRRVCTPFQDALAIKIPSDLLNGYGVMGVLSWRCLVAAKSSAPHSGETVRQTPEVLEVQERISPCQIWWGSDFARRRGDQKRWPLKRPLTGKFSKMFSKRIHGDIDPRLVCKFREIWLTGNWWNRALLTSQKKQNFGSRSRSRFCADRA